MTTIKNRGTPKTLNEMIVNEITVGPMRSLEFRLNFATRDFLAQKFAVAFLRAHISPEAEKILQDLWREVTKESKK